MFLPLNSFASHSGKRNSVVDRVWTSILSRLSSGNVACPKRFISVAIVSCLVDRITDLRATSLRPFAPGPATGFRRKTSRFGFPQESPFFHLSTPRPCATVRMSPLFFNKVNHSSDKT